MSEQATREATSPPTRSGHYSTDGQWWWEDRQRRWLPVGEQVDILRVELEQLEPVGHETAPGDQVWYRLVGRATSPDPRWPSYQVEGPRFCAPRMSLEQLTDAMWADGLSQRFEELRDTLRVQGWRCVRHGAYPWSVACVRPWLASSHAA